MDIFLIHDYEKTLKTLILTLDLVPEKSCSSSFIHPRSAGKKERN